MIDKILQILKEEIVPAEGCTEPIALAYAASLVTRAFDGRIAGKMYVRLSGNMIKNVKSVHIPNSCGKVGIEYAVALGAILGDSRRKLMVISEIDESRMDEVSRYVSEGRIKVALEKEVPKLYIRIDAWLDADSGKGTSDKVSVEIRDFHTNVTCLELNGKSLLSDSEKRCSEKSVDVKESYTDRSFLTIDLICKEADMVDTAAISPIFEKVIAYNSAIAQEGLNKEYGIAIGKTILEGIECGEYGNDIKNNLTCFAAAGSDARMNGCPLPVMTTSGSGNQGMTCSLPVIKFCQMKSYGHDKLLRGLFVSHLITIHIKEVIGRLSAYCGAMAASAGVSGALAYLDGMDTDKVKMAVENTLATVSGVICDGAKSSCATKIATGIAAAVDSYFAARKGRCFRYGEGIVGENIESTISHVGTLGCDGMSITDDVILKIMMEE